jgi:hypothetical protein
MIPKNLNDDQKARRNEVSAEMLQRLETESDFLNRVITDDESWVFEYAPETKRQSEGMAHATVSKTDESSHEQIKTQENCHHFLRSSWGS